MTGNIFNCFNRLAAKVSPNDNWKCIKSRAAIYTRIPLPFPCLVFFTSVFLSFCLFLTHCDTHILSLSFSFSPCVGRSSIFYSRECVWFLVVLLLPPVLDIYTNRKRDRQTDGHTPLSLSLLLSSGTSCTPQILPDHRRNSFSSENTSIPFFSFGTRYKRKVWESSKMVVSDSGISFCLSFCMLTFGSLFLPLLCFYLLHHTTDYCTPATLCHYRHA